MDYYSFQYTLDMGHPPVDFSEGLKALWWDAKGEWDTAHKIVQDLNDQEAAWVHAYLHRKEGDESNASYWYGNAGKEKPDLSIHDEFQEIVSALLTDY